MFCLKTRLKRVSFACETLRVNASERVTDETNEGFRRDLFSKRVWMRSSFDLRLDAFFNENSSQMKRLNAFHIKAKNFQKIY